ncbi:15811_t:CDS:2 [Dentiscutata erythropus]|uniref:15811_t:CDS:1 n=1 Tax=Dentiscutata erythropus TaxID=1348616 RepID=A0A9N9DXE2_9GLOM|nr:15811_t:CDS:2 [Dentiscutata erythropus]
MKGAEKIREEFCPFRVEISIDPQADKGQLLAITVEILDTLFQIAPSQMQEPLASPEVRIDYTWAGLVEKDMLKDQRSVVGRMQAVMGLEALPSEVDILVSFLVWLDLAHSFSGYVDFLVAVSREHLEHHFSDLSKDYRVKRIYKALRTRTGPRNAYNRTGEVVDVDLDKDGGGKFENDLDEDSQKEDNRIREEFVACFRGKKKVKSVPVDVFLTALSSIKKKMDRNFSALYREIEDGDRPYEQYEYDFLAKIGKYLDKAIRVLPEYNRKEIVGVHEEVESRAVTLRLADNKGWGTALQIVGSNDKIMEKYKDRILLFSQVGQSSCSYEWAIEKKLKSISTKKKEHHLLHLIQEEIITHSIRIGSATQQ